MKPEFSFRVETLSKRLDPMVWYDLREHDEMRLSTGGASAPVRKSFERTAVTKTTEAEIINVGLETRARKSSEPILSLLLKN